MKAKAHRSQLEMDISVLQNCVVPIIISQLMLQTAINHATLCSYVERLVGAGLLQVKQAGFYAGRVQREFLVTERGRKLLGLWRSFDTEYFRAFVEKGFIQHRVG